MKSLRRTAVLAPIVLAWVAIGLHHLPYFLKMREARRLEHAAAKGLVDQHAHLGPVAKIDEVRLQAEHFRDLRTQFESQSKPPLGLAEWDVMIPASMRPFEISRSGTVTVISASNSQETMALVEQLSQVKGYAAQDVQTTTATLYLTLTEAPP